MGSQKPTKLVSRQEEKELLKIGEQLFREEFPNPKRSGCPTAEALRDLAFRSQQLPLSERNRYFDHMTCCSPCFTEFSAFVDQAHYRKRFLVVGVCAAMLIAIGLAAWLGINQWRNSFSRGGSISQKPPSTERPNTAKNSQNENGSEHNQEKQETAIAKGQAPPEIYQSAVLDLRDQAVARGEHTRSPVKKYPRIPRGHLNLSIYLPFGSEPGKYQVRIYKNPKIPLLDTMGTATIRKPITVLELKVNTSQMPPGRYILETRPADWTSGYKYAFLVAE